MKTLLLGTIGILGISNVVFAETPGKTYTYSDIIHQQKEGVMPISFEIGGVYNIANNKLFGGEDNIVGKINTWGGDLTGVFNLTTNHAITLRFGYAYGDKSKTESYGDYSDTYKHEISSFTLMPGYRYSFRPSDKWNVYVGAHAGLDSIHVKETYSYENEREAEKKKSTGFGYAIELGVNYSFSENVSIFAAYQYGGSTARTKWGEEEDRYKTKRQTYNTFRIGACFQF